MVDALLSCTGKQWDTGAIMPGRVPVQSVLEALYRSRRLDSGPATLIDPWVFPDMPAAVERIHRSMQTGEHVCIFSDYDCDGITAATMLYRMFRRRGIEPMVRLPHRVRDGYGLSAAIVQELVHNDVHLLITADTGIASAAEIAMLYAHGIDTIVTDHHSAPAMQPDAIILHPALSPGYPIPYPSGAGVAYQLVRACEEATEWEGCATDAALAMVGTIADIVDLTGANRLIVQRGLAALRDLPASAPLRQLLASAHVQPDQATSTDIGFRIAPRINASGRMDDPIIALRGLMGDKTAIASLETLNRERQAETERCLRHAADALPERREDMPPLIALADASFGHGIIGLIASRLTEQTGRPSIIATIDEDMCIASLRSPAGYHITQALERHSNFLLRFGGHAQAAGCTLELQKWDALCTALHDDVCAHMDTRKFAPTLHIDACLEDGDISFDLLATLAHMEPFGAGNPEPLFLMERAVLRNVRSVGTDGAHLQCTIGNTKAIGFRLGAYAHMCHQPLDIACRLGTDEWQGYKRPQIIIEDMRLPNASAENVCTARFRQAPNAPPSQIHP